jgi:hypothetical protein
MEPNEKTTTTDKKTINLAPFFMVMAIWCLGGYVAIEKSPEAALFLMGCAFAFLAIMAAATAEEKE